MRRTLKLRKFLSPKLLLVGLTLAGLLVGLFFLTRWAFFGKKDSYQENCETLHEGGDSKFKCKCRCKTAAECKLPNGKTDWACVKLCRETCAASTSLRSRGAVESRFRRQNATAVDPAAVAAPVYDPTAVADPADPAYDPTLTDPAAYDPTVYDPAITGGNPRCVSKFPGVDSKERCKCECNKKYPGNVAKIGKCKKQNCKNLPAWVAGVV